jgi:hypothetical protein
VTTDGQSVTVEEKLQKIAAVYSTKSQVGDFAMDTHALYNLDGAIIDLERTHEVDDVCLRTLKRVREQLREIEEILEIRKAGQ